MQIITITPNPAIDLSTSVGKMVAFTKMRCARALRDPGGGGINVARVINRLGGQVAAIYPAGGSSGDLLRRLLDREGVSSIAIRAMAETREDFTVFEETTRQQYRFVMPGAPLSEQEWSACLRELENFRPQPDIVVASGSLPPGVPEDFYSRVARLAKQRGAKVIVDTAGAALKEVLAEGVYLIKPNLREFCDLTGVRGSDEKVLIEAGRDLIAKGRVSLIALSLGPEGAMLIAGDRVLRAEALPIQVESVVGAGDSFVGAITWSIARGDDLSTTLSMGAAGGSAALLSAGTGLCKPDAVHRLASQVAIRSVNLRV